MVFDLHLFSYNFYAEYVQYLIIIIAAESMQPLMPTQ